MPDKLTKLRIFVAAPSDVASERAKVATVAEQLKPMADYLGLTLEVVDWRDVVPDAGRPQQIIFDQLKPTSWDIFVGILWSRFGTPPGGKDPQTQREYLSGTEEEFRVAYRLWKTYGKPRIVMYRCTRAIPVDADFTQAQRVKDFFTEIQDPQGEFRVLTQSFDTIETFEKLLLDNLQKLLIEYGDAHGKGGVSPPLQAPTIPNNLPRRAAFFGRAKEMDAVMRALSPEDRTWGVLIDGIGGIGKTALAIEAAHRAQDAGTFDAFVFVTAKQTILEPSGIKERTPAARTLDDFLNETARVLGQIGIPRLTGDAKRRALLDALRATRTLLIYDNLETLSKEEQEAVADFLRELPHGCKAIITSRRRGGEGAVWLRLEKLDWDTARQIILNQMSLDAGLANKLRRVPEARWQELYDETNGSPLALVHTLGLMRVRATLTFDGALEMLRGNRDPDLQKFVFQEARKELTENDKTALGALSFFVPSATFEAWMEVAELSRNALETTIDRLSALSLVDVLAGEERYALHPLTRNFVRDELLADANVARETGMRFARYWVDYAQRYGGDYNYKTYDRLEAEWTNLDATANWLWETARVQGKSVGDKDAAQMLNDLADALRQFLWFGGLWQEQAQLCTHAYEAMRSLNDWSNAAWRAFDVARNYYYRACTDEAIKWADNCAEIWGYWGIRDVSSMDTLIRGLVALQYKNYDQAASLLQEAYEFSIRFVGEHRFIARVLVNLGALASELKNYDIARDYYRYAYEHFPLGDEEGQAIYEGHIGEYLLDKVQQLEVEQLSEKEKSLCEVRWHFSKQLDHAQKVQCIDLIAQAKYGLARVHEAEGRADLALPLAQEALKIYERLQHKNLAAVRELVERLKEKIPPP